LDGEEPVDTTPLFVEKVDSDLRDRLFPHGVQNAFALELHEFLTAIAEGRQPETSGMEGLRDIAPGLAILESSTLRRPVKVEDVEACRVESYQREINEYFGVE